MDSLLNQTTEWDENDKYLRLERTSIRKLISLPPKYLGDLNEGINKAILKSDQEIFKEFNGFPIAICKRKLLQNLGSSIDDHAFIQFYVDIECIVFKPKINKKVKAVVNQVGQFYIACLICGKVNATIFKKNPLNANNRDDAQVKESEALNNLQIGQHILLTIKSIKYEQNNISIISEYVSTLPEQ